MRFVIIAALAGSLLVPIQSANAAATPSEKSQVVQEKRCKKIEQMGSRIKKRICLTEDQWEQVELNAKELGTKLQDGGNIGDSPID